MTFDRPRRSRWTRPWRRLQRWSRRTPTREVIGVVAVLAVAVVLLGVAVAAAVML